MKNILAAVDFSPVSSAVIEQATALSQAFGAALWMLHVAAPDPDFVGYEPGPQSVRRSVAAGLHDDHRRLQEESAAVRQRGVDCTALLVQGTTPDTIVREADRLGVDLVVLGSHGHGAIRRALLGSVSEHVLHHARRPLLIVPAPRA
ncbi:universal stress protein [bacterium]|nr:universal stress protein [bacterium]